MTVAGPAHTDIHHTEDWSYCAACGRVWDAGVEPDKPCTTNAKPKPVPPCRAHDAQSQEAA